MSSSEYKHYKSVSKLQSKITGNEYKCRYKISLDSNVNIKVNFLNKDTQI